MEPLIKSSYTHKSLKYKHVAWGSLQSNTASLEKQNIVSTVC